MGTSSIGTSFANLNDLVSTTDEQQLAHSFLQVVLAFFGCWVFSSLEEWQHQKVDEPTADDGGGDDAMALPKKGEKMVL
jgi:hypothetical protein